MHSFRSLLSRSLRANQTFTSNSISKRFLNLHEYQSQILMRKHGICVPNGYVAHTPEEAEEVAKKLSTPDCVVKAQILAGGRGLGKFKNNGFQGGVHLVKSPAEAREVSKKMLGDILVTKQTGPAGKPVNTVLIAQRYSIAREAYFSILMDRSFGGPVLIGSPDGGVNIEDVAAKTPERILKLPVDISKGLRMEDALKMANFIGFGKQATQTAELIKKLYDFFISTDSTMVEINPFAETTDGEVMVMDAKVNFDDNSEFRQHEIFQQRDFTQEDAREVNAKKFDLNYIGLDGNIGCLVNGAGLAMATMDVIQIYGGKPANFLDVGGGASQNQVTEAIKLISSDPSVKAILVNIFGGIMRCDVIARGLIEAASNLHVPLIVRLKGTNVEIGTELMKNSGLKITTVNDLDEAARAAVEAIKS